MGFTIDVKPEEGYVLLVVRGHITRKSALRQNREAHAIGRGYGITRYLVDLRDARNTDTVPDQYDFAYSDMRTDGDIDRKARVAMVAAPEDHSHDFVELVARNAGLSVRLFRDMAPARAYLGLVPPQPAGD